MSGDVKQCRRCAELLPLTEYSPGKARCRPCSNAEQRERYHSDPQWRAHKARYRTGRRKENAAYLREWRARNPTALRDYAAKHYAVQRASELGIEGILTEDVSTQDVTAMYGDACIYCDGPFEHFDHATPISRGGHHVLSNVVPACQHDNIAKSNRTALEYRKYLRSKQERD